MRTIPSRKEKRSAPATATIPAGSNRGKIVLSQVLSGIACGQQVPGIVADGQENTVFFFTQCDRLPE
jgi:hypothetical protein